MIDAPLYLVSYPLLLLSMSFHVIPNIVPYLMTHQVLPRNHECTKQNKAIKPTGLIALLSIYTIFSIVMSSKFFLN